MDALSFIIICLVVFIIAFKCTGTKENLDYLKQYEAQDHWRNNPTIWPIAQIPAMADYEIERKNQEQI